MLILALLSLIFSWWHTRTSSLRSRRRATRREYLVSNYIRVQGREHMALRPCCICGQGSTGEPLCMWFLRNSVRFGGCHSNLQSEYSAKSSDGWLQYICVAIWFGRLRNAWFSWSSFMNVISWWIILHNSLCLFCRLVIQNWMRISLSVLG